MTTNGVGGGGGANKFKLLSKVSIFMIDNAVCSSLFANQYKCSELLSRTQLAIQNKKTGLEF